MKHRPYKLTINLKKRELKYKNYIGYTIKQPLNKTPLRFLLLMSDNETKTITEIAEYMKCDYGQQVWRLVKYIRDEIPVAEIKARNRFWL